MLREHAGPVEADLLRFYNVDLLDFYRGTLTMRRLSVLLRALPAESALARSLSGPEAQWQLSDHLLALAVDELRVASWQRANAGSKNPRPLPDRIPRPGVDASANKTVRRGAMKSDEEMEAEIAKYRPVDPPTEQEDAAND